MSPQHRGANTYVQVQPEKANTETTLQQLLQSSQSRGRVRFRKYTYR